MRYIPHTPEDIQRMLKVVGKPSVAALFDHIPERVRARRPLDIAPLDEGSLLLPSARAAATCDQRDVHGTPDRRLHLDEEVSCHRPREDRDGPKRTESVAPLAVSLRWTCAADA